MLRHTKKIRDFKLVTLHQSSATGQLVEALCCTVLVHIVLNKYKNVSDLYHVSFNPKCTFQITFSRNINNERVCENIKNSESCNPAITFFRHRFFFRLIFLQLDSNPALVPISASFGGKVR